MARLDDLKGLYDSKLLKGLGYTFQHRIEHRAAGML